jgi:anaerobic dimethyl sulfoxide reductase subunit A
MVRLPVYLWADAALRGREGGYPGDVKILYNVGGNYIIQGSDISKNIKAFMRAEFSVCHEHFLTPTARYCDYILPATTFLEREDILFPGLNYLFYSGRAAAPLGETKNDFEIFSLLAQKLGIGEEYKEGKDENQWVDACLEVSEIKDKEAFKRTGIYSGKNQERVGLADFIKDPAGSPLATPSGLIELCSEKYRADTGFPAVPVPRYEAPEKGYPLRMATPHAKFRVNSQNGNILHFIGKEPQQVLMHKVDALDRGISDNEEVRIYSPIGEVVVRAALTDELMRGVVVLLQGAWPGFSSGGATNRDNPNFCTSSEPTKPSNGSRTHTVFVQVEKRGKGG